MPTHSEWTARYSQSHRHPVNQMCHLLGIPMIAVSLPLALAALFLPELWRVALALFVIGWVLQFIGHAVEGKPPEFLRDWRFLFVGLRWWLDKVRAGPRVRGTDGR